MPRFVILEHDHPQVHWDFMLEVSAVLRTWRLAEAPTRGGGHLDATALADHRPFYLDYEGPVSGNRGNVRRWDTGTYDLLASTDAALQVQLHGAKLTGIAWIEKEEEADWRFTFQEAIDHS